MSNMPEPYLCRFTYCSTYVTWHKITLFSSMVSCLFRLFCLWRQTGRRQAESTTCTSSSASTSPCRRYIYNTYNNMCCRWMFISLTLVSFILLVLLVSMLLLFWIVHADFVHSLPRQGWKGVGRNLGIVPNSSFVFSSSLINIIGCCLLSRCSLLPAAPSPFAPSEIPYQSSRVRSI